MKVKKEFDPETKEEKVFLETLPMLMEDYEPDLVDLPMFMIRLATEVDWSEEKPCFDGICRELAVFFSIKNLNYSKAGQGEASTGEKSSASGSQKQPDDNWIIEHILYSAYRNMLLPSNENEKQTFFKLVDLSKLYKVFERC